MTTTYDIPPCPMPGAPLMGGTVIASGEHSDEPVMRYGVLILNPSAPFYTVAEITDDGRGGYAVDAAVSLPNIVPATAKFDEWFGFWGES